MTRTTDTAKTSPTAPKGAALMSREEVQKMLRDAAFVLHMTRRVKDEIMAGRPEAPKPAAPKAPELAAGLGV